MVEHTGAGAILGGKRTGKKTLLMTLHDLELSPIDILGRQDQGDSEVESTSWGLVNLKKLRMR